MTNFTNTTINIYAIQDKNTGYIINYKNNMFYTTRNQARNARRQIQNKNARIVKTTFSSTSQWEPAK